MSAPNKPCVCEAGDACDFHRATCITCLGSCQGHPSLTEVLYNLEVLGVFPTLREAWLALKERVQHDLDRGALFVVTLNEMIHFQRAGNTRPGAVLDFYTVRDLACDHGW